MLLFMTAPLVKGMLGKCLAVALCRNTPLEKICMFLKSLFPQAVGTDVVHL